MGTRYAILNSAGKYKMETPTTEESCIRKRRNMRQLACAMLGLCLVVLSTSPLLPQPKPVSHRPRPKTVLDLQRELYEQRLSAIPEGIPDTAYFKKLGVWGWGITQAVAVQGHYAFIGNGITFQTLDVSDPTHPVLAAQLNVGNLITDIQLKGSAAFVANRLGLVVIDISTPTAPRQMSFTSISGITMALTLQDSLAYVGTMSGYLVVVDISNAASPVVHGAVSVYPIERVQLLSSRGRYAYVADAEFQCVRVFDALDPDTPQVDTSICFLDIFQLTSILQHDSLLFLGAADFSDTQSIRFCSIADPLNIRELARLPVTIFGPLRYNPIIGMAVEGNYLYATVWDSGVYCIDISNILSPTVVGHLGVTDYTDHRFEKSMSVLNGSMYIACASGLWILDASVPGDIKEESFFVTGGIPNRVSVKGDVAFIATIGVWILDVSDGLNPRAVSHVDMWDYVTDVLVDGHLLYFAVWEKDFQDSAGGLWIADVSSPESPQILSHYVGINHNAHAGDPTKIAKSRNYIFMTQATDHFTQPAVEIIDVSEPQHPVRAGVVIAQYDPYELAVKDTLLYLVTDLGLKAMSTANPAAPMELSSTFPYAVAAAVRDTFLCVIVDSFYVMSASDPQKLVRLGAAGVPWSLGFGAYMKFFSDDVLLWEASDAYTMDVSNPAAPRQILQLSGGFSGSDFKGDTVVFANGLSGVWLYRFDTLATSRVPVDLGWNLLSLPRHSRDKAKSFLYPTAASNAFIYDGTGYKSSDTLTPGAGYWLKFSFAQDVAIDGAPLMSDTTLVSRGWNIIGSLTIALPLGGISSEPPGIIVSSPFGFHAGYFPADTLMPGRGYWLKVSEAGRIVLTAPGK